jgi:hypothetical protein
VQSDLSQDFRAPGRGHERTGGITLTDGDTNTTDRLAGASWFGGNLNYVKGMYEFADTEFFNILGPSGGVVARVAGVEHSGSGGSNFSFTFGQCEAPQN